MSTTAITLEGRAPISIAEGRLNPNAIIAQRNAIIECLQKTMKRDVDFGIIPGTPKPTLFKPGSEKVLSMFHLGTRIVVEDLSTPDRYHYRVRVVIFHQPTDVVLGEGIGEASSAESKYQWREVICQEEWDATPEDRRRTKWKKANPKPYSVRQVRADMDDISNTVLKMAKKRAQIDATLTCTAASDMFAQDIEDLQDAGLDPNIGENHPPSDPLPQNLQPKQSPPAQSSQHVSSQPTQHAQAPAPAHTAPAQNDGETISEGEAKLFWAKAIGRCNDYKLIMDYLKTIHGVTNKSMILKTRVKEALKWAQTGLVD